MKKRTDKRKEIVLPQIKLKYFSSPKHGADDFICVQCGKRATKIGSTNVLKNPPEKSCENCAIENYAESGGFHSLEAAAAHRRRMFDVNYLFQEIVIDRILVEEHKQFEDLSNDEYAQIMQMANDIWNDDEVIDREEKIYIEEIYNQDEIEDIFAEILDDISFHKVSMEPAEDGNER